MIIIRHRTGPLAGKEQRIETKSDRILFGRDPNACDVVFPREETIVARRHFALVRMPSGQWTFQLFGDPFVAMDGLPAEAGAAVRSGARIELGQRGGPSFEVVLEAEGLNDGLPLTQTQEKVEGSRAAAAHARQLALAGAALALLAAIGVGAVMYSSHSTAARLNSAVEALNREQVRVAAESISGAIRDRAVQAAHFVVTRKPGSESYGTASPIAPDLLATNAHVAESFLGMGAQGRMFVRAPGPNGREYDVVEVRIHPGYRAFQAFLQQDPFFVEGWRLTGAEIPSYDVAILRVAANSNLSPVLEIASPEELADLKPGYPLVRAGYPTENVAGSEIQSQRAATPNLAAGMISGMTDMFRLPADPAHRRLVHHSVPSAGGASGSPLVGPNGKIVALNNAGTYIFVSKDVSPNRRISSSVLINYGQRADWLLDLLAGGADAALEADREYWQKQTAAFKRGIEVLVPAVLDGLKPKTGGTPVLKARDKFALQASDRYEAPARPGQQPTTKRQKAHPVKLAAGKLNSFIGYAANRVGIQLYVVIDEKIVEQDERATFVPRINYSPPADVNADIYVVGPDEDVSYTFFHYEWDPPRS